MKKLEEIINNHFNAFGTSKANELSASIRALIFDFSENKSKGYSRKSAATKMEEVDAYLERVLKDKKTLTMPTYLIPPFSVMEIINLELTDYSNRCGICGGNLVIIRGKYPGTEKRKVCSQCLQERLDQIKEISSPNYGKTCQNVQM